MSDGAMTNNTDKKKQDADSWNSMKEQSGKNADARRKQEEQSRKEENPEQILKKIEEQGKKKSATEVAGEIHPSLRPVAEHLRLPVFVQSFLNNIEAYFFAIGRIDANVHAGAPSPSPNDQNDLKAIEGYRKTMNASLSLRTPNEQAEIVRQFPQAVETTSGYTISTERYRWVYYVNIAIIDNQLHIVSSRSTIGILASGWSGWFEGNRITRPILFPTFNEDEQRISKLNQAALGSSNQALIIATLQLATNYTATLHELSRGTSTLRGPTYGKCVTASLSG